MSLFITILTFEDDVLKDTQHNYKYYIPFPTPNATYCILEGYCVYIRGEAIHYFPKLFINIHVFYCPFLLFLSRRNRLRKISKTNYKISQNYYETEL